MAPLLVNERRVISSFLLYICVALITVLPSVCESSNSQMVVDLNMNGNIPSNDEYGHMEINLQAFHEKLEESEDKIISESSGQRTGKFIRSEKDESKNTRSSKLVIGSSGYLSGNNVPLPICPGINILLESPKPVQTTCNVVHIIKELCVQNALTLFQHYDEQSQRTKGLIQGMASYDFTNDNRLRDYPRMIREYNHKGHPALPLNIPSDVLSSERLTYLFYYSLIMRIYRNALNIRSMEEWQRNEKDDYPSFNGYNLHQVSYWHEDSPEERELNRGKCDYFLNTPASYSMIKIMPDKEYDHMIIVNRGTLSGYEWAENFSYNLIHDSRIPGKVTVGFRSLLDQTLNYLLPSLRERKENSKQLKITLVGHSLGGAISNLLGAYLHYHLGFEDIEVIALGSPACGDKEFYNYIHSHLNIRFISFTANGFERFGGPNEVIMQVAKTGYTYGDMVPQVYSCGSLPDCPNLQELTDDKKPLKLHAETLNVGPFYGMVAFTADDMPNTVQWKRNTDLIFEIENFAYGWMVLGPHLCGYMCYLAQELGDDTTRNFCNFPGQEIEGSENFCDVRYDPTYPRFYGSAEQIEWIRSTMAQPLTQIFLENGVF